MNDFNERYVFLPILNKSIDIRMTKEASSFACDSFLYVFHMIAILQAHNKILSQPFRSFQSWVIQEGKRRNLYLSCYDQGELVHTEKIQYFIYPLCNRFELWEEVAAQETYLVIGLEGQFQGLKSA